MSVLQTTWQGELCHKNKVIAQVNALAGQDLPIPIQRRLDVHQKVKFEEFRDKVVNKTSGKLSFDTFVSHDEHLLLVTLLQPETGSHVLESFNNFLYKSQSVGVSIIGANDSVIFLVPAKLDPGGVFPICPHTDHSEEPCMYGVIKISKSLVPTINACELKTEETGEGGGEGGAACQPSEEDVKTDFTPSTEATPSRDLTRLSVYMSNLPALQAHKTQPPEKQEAPQEFKEKRKLSLSQYRQRIDSSTGPENPLQSDSPDKPTDTQPVGRGSATVGEPRTGSESHTEGVGTTGSPVDTIDSKTTSDIRPVVAIIVPDTDDQSCTEHTVVTQTPSKTPSTTVGDDVHTDRSDVPIPDSSHQYQEAFGKKMFENEPMFTTGTQYNIVNSTSESLPTVEKVEQEVNVDKYSSEVVTTTPAVTIQQEATEEIKIPTPKYAENREAGNVQPLHLPEQQFQISTNLLVDKEKDVTEMTHPTNTIKREQIDAEYSKYTVIEPIEQESAVKYEASSLDEEADLPDLHDVDDIPQDEESDLHPGESVSFNRIQSVIFTPDIYAKILDHLDTLKLLLGETALRNSTAHRERCMSMVDKIGDRLIGNRLKKTCITRSFGCKTSGSNSTNPCKEVQTDFGNDTTVQNTTQEKSQEKPSNSVNTEEKTGSSVQDAEKQNNDRNKSKRRRGRKSDSKENSIKDKQKNGMDVEEANKLVKLNRKRKHSESSENTDAEAEGYFTMLLKLNGALEDEKRRSKTVTRVQKTVRRIRKSNVESTHTEASSAPTVQKTVRRIRKSNVESTHTEASSAPTVQQTVRRIRKSNVESTHTEASSAPTVQQTVHEQQEERYSAGTPEIGKTAYEATPIKLVDGRLMYSKQDNYSASNGQMSIQEPQHNVTSSHVSQAYQSQVQTLPWQGTARQEQPAYSVTNMPASEVPSAYIPPPPPPDYSPFSAALTTPPVNPPVNPPLQPATLLYGHNTQETSQTNNFGQSDYPENSLESDIQKSLNDVDLRQPLPPPPPAVPSVTTNQPQLVPYDGAMSTSILPAADTTTTMVNTTTETASFYTDSSVTVYNQEHVIDQDMEAEMIDILEILHEGSAPEVATLKKPKGRSKRARKKRRAIAEAEKLYSLVVMAQKIENQQKLNVLSEKQKKREFYKKIIHTYAKKGDEPMKPKDEESMILECVEQLMDNPSDTEGSTKTESTDQASKKKGEEEFALDEYDGLTEAAAAKAPDNSDCQIIENIRHERLISDQLAKRGKERRGYRSSSRDRSAYSPPDRVRRRRSPSVGRSHSTSSNRYRRQICHEGDSNPELLHTSPDHKNLMFQGWSNNRYISHLFTTANKITFGSSDSSKSWKSKVTASSKALGERKAALRARIADNRKCLRSAQGMSFRQRDRAEQQRRENLEDLRDIDTLQALYDFYSCKFSILEVLQNAAREKQTNPESDKLILKQVCTSLEGLLEKLCEARGLLEQEVKQNLSSSDRHLVRKALDECQDMIANIRKETRKHKEAVKA